MKRVCMLLMCLLAMLAAGTSLKAQEVTIVLNPGWTWMSCPMTEAVDFTAALGDFTPMQGDIIKSQWGQATYINGQWRGGISQFYPGYGYKYKSNRTVPVMVTFNAQQPAVQVVVTTSEPMLITAISAMGGGEVTTTDGTYIIVKGLCWATHENPTTNDDFYQEAESGVGSFSISMTELNISTTYYVRAYAVTPNGTVYGAPKSFTTRDGIPTLTTAEVTNITGATATCGGNITDNGGLNVTARGVCWSTSPNPTVADSHTTNGSGTGSFSSSITGLNVSTTYYVRAYATTAAGTAYGEEKTFTTRDGIPTLTTAEVTNITGATATCGGNITDNGGLNVTARGVCWSTSPNPTVADSHTTNGSGNGSFSSSITGLNVSTTYYVRAYATTAAGTAYGEEKTFTTRDGIPTLTTAEVTNITGATATCGGNITDNGGLNVTARGVCWSTSPNPTVADSHTTNGSGNGSFSSSITGLNVSTTYYVRAYATTNAGTAYGNEVNFTTRDGIPTLTTTDITNITGVSATSGGNITDNGGLNVTARGVCWSTLPNPTVADSHTTNGSGSGSFSSYMTGLSFNTTYYVRAYATNSQVTVYGNQIFFNSGDGYVDLGLPSGTLWATCNVGADNPEDYGDYFAWGETQPKDTYGWSTYQYSNDGDWNHPNLTKYCNNSNYGYNGFTDNLTTLLPEDDAARANWGNDWRMPTKDEWQELRDNTTCTLTFQNSVRGWLFTASNGNSLFLPSFSPDQQDAAFYWSSSLGRDPVCAWYFCCDWIGCYVGDVSEQASRECGLTVRAVRCKSSVINVTADLAEGGFVSGGGTYMDHTYCTVSATAYEGYAFAWWTENGLVISTDASYSFVVNGNRDLVAHFVAPGEHTYVNLGLPSGTLWATCNVGADYPEDYGDYFAWGETMTKSDYSWSTYQYCNGSSSTLTKYCDNSGYGYNGFTDNLTTLLPEDDAATANWDNGWRMPTEEEWWELYDNTTVTWTRQNGVNGELFTASNGNSIFLPAAGWRYHSSLYDAIYGYYWSSSLCTDYPLYAWYLNFNNGYLGYGMYSDGDRCYGRFVRPVRVESQN